jgi:sulfofructose kinase
MVEEMPRRAEKFRALDAAIAGGGCAATAAVAVARLGGKPVLASRVGGDRIGEMILEDLVAEGVDCDLVRVFEAGRSSFSSVYVDRAGERQIVSYRDRRISADAAWLEARMPDRFDAVLADTRWPEGAAAVMAAARALSRPGVLDAEAPVGEAAEAVRLASHIAFSAQGLREYAGNDDLVAALREAAGRTRAWVCVTDGARGVTWLDGGEPVHMPAPRVEVVDTLGAGDTWHGAFVLALAEGRGEREAIRFANAAASLKCTRFGGRAGIPRREEVEKMLAGA